MSSFISSSSESKESESRSNTNPKKSYDVYLSFCSSDTGYFVSNLCTALYTEAGIVVFWDDQRLESEDRALTPSVLNAIGESRIAIIVFSKSYANSRSCLQELEKIMECCRTIGQRVVPLFYDVDPSYASRPIPIGMFGKAFNDFVHRLISMEETSEEEDKFMSWVAAICAASTISELFVHEDRKKSENTIKLVVKHVTHVLNKPVAEHVTRVLKKRDLFVADYPMGVKSRAQDVIQLLKQSKRPLLLGIWGMAGIGKTTIAHSIWYQIGPYFEDMSFALNGWASLQERLRHKRVLVILDDVTKLEQLNALCGSREWFGEGSKIIITTRNRHLLNEHGVDHIYRVKELDQTESLEVFNWHAFKQASPKDDFVELSREIVARSGGLPLALRIHGSALYGKDVPRWENVMQKLQRFLIPIEEVRRVLEGAFNDLNDKEKQIFLDIACFFVGKDQNDVLHILNRSAQFAALQISHLEDKCFVTIDENNKLGMNVLLQAMAREIITRESRNKPEKLC